MKRNVLGTALAAAGFVLAMSVGARAENFPARPVTLIVPWPAGGSTDVGMRALAGAAEKHLGQSIVVENRPGGSGTLGPGQMAATAKPDGYTIAQIPITVFRFPFMQKTSFDPATDFTYIIGVSGYTFGVVVRDDASWKTFRDLIADARANPTRINYGTPGAGTSLHITMEQIAKQQGIKWTHVPFKGNADSMNALLGGHIHAVADSSGWAQLVNAGRFRLLRGQQDLVEYAFNTRVARHLFCRTCGIKSFYVPRSNPDGFSVNARCIDRTTVTTLTIEPFDGRDWEQSAGRLRNLSVE
jgi:tripartite-type tricarboxylate transporter receptor subunit TctC